MNIRKVLVLVLPLLISPAIRAGGDTLSAEDIATRAGHKGMFLNVLRKQADGDWKLSHHSVG
ncbi:MAG TPA: hypothetical protein VMO76_02285 [Candidatus Udaeobacter sp.]|nr:hypothetical protein [Candidatus Udaeobacter sp.]